MSSKLVTAEKSRPESGLGFEVDVRGKRLRGESGRRMHAPVCTPNHQEGLIQRRGLRIEGLRVEGLVFRVWGSMVEG